MTTAFAAAFGIAGLAFAVTAFILLRQEDEPVFAAVLGVPGAAFIYASADYLVRVIA